MSAFKFGKWVSSEGDFLGRHIKQLDDRIVIDQEKYILKNIRGVEVPRGRRGQLDLPATESEKRAFATTVYHINWVAKEVRPEVAGAAFLLAVGRADLVFHDG